MDERALIEKLLRIEALHAGATTPGERTAAEKAMARTRARLEEVEALDPPFASRSSLPDPCKQKLFLALARRYGLQPHRRWGQRYPSGMIKVPARCVDETLWPEFVALSETLDAFLGDVTTRVIAETIHKDSSEAREMPETKGLPGPRRSTDGRRTARRRTDGMDRVYWPSVNRTLVWLA